MNLTGKAVCVTGGAGFIGSHLVERIAALGAGRVVVIDSLKYGSRRNLGSSSAVELVDLDLAAARVEDLARVLRGVDLLFHLAAEKYNTSRDEPRSVLSTNIQGTYNLLSAAAASAVRKVVFASSLYAYGRTSGGPFSETDLPVPATVYGISKLCGERLLDHFVTSGDLDGVSLRYFFVYGPRQFAGVGYPSVIVKGFSRIRDGLPPVIVGDGSQQLDYVYVADVVDATLRAALRAGRAEVINVASGRGTSVRELTEVMLRVAGSGLDPVFEPPDWTAGSSRTGTTARARDALGWTASTSMEQGLAETWKWVRAVNRVEERSST